LRAFAPSRSSREVDPLGSSLLYCQCCHGVFARAFFVATGTAGLEQTLSWRRRLPAGFSLPIGRRPRLLAATLRAAVPGRCRASVGLWRQTVFRRRADVCRQCGICVVQCRRFCPLSFSGYFLVTSRRHRRELCRQEVAKGGYKESHTVDPNGHPSNRIANRFGRFQA